MAFAAALAPPAQIPTFRRSLPVLIVISLIMTTSFTMMGSFSMIQEAVKAEMGLSDYALSVLFGLSPWRGVQIVLAGFSLLLSIPLLLIRETARHEIAAAGDKPPFHVVAAELWSRRRFLIPLFVGQIGVVMADQAAMICTHPA